MIIHAFLYDQDFLNTASLLDPIFKTGGVCVPSQHALSYFVNPEEIVDPRGGRSGSLNATFLNKARLILDPNLYASVLTDINNLWTLTEKQNLFAIIDQLCFAYAANATTAEVELGLAPWSQYLANSFVLSTTHSSATVYEVLGNTATIVCPDYVTFTFVITNGTQYQFRLWLNNALFMADYPLSTIRQVIPPLPPAELYTVNVLQTASVFAVALQAAGESQTIIQPALQSGLYTGYQAVLVPFMDARGDTVQVQFNLLYNGAVPGAIAVRTAIREYLLGSGVGTSNGWKALAPSLFITQLFYLLPLWDNTTSLIVANIYPNITPTQKAITDANTILFDLPTGFVTANLDIMSVTYDNLTVMAVPDTENSTSRVSLLGEHPTYQDVPTTSINYESMTPTTQQFAALMNAALAVAAGVPNTNAALTAYTPPSDTRHYITFSAGDVEYWVITQASYLTLLGLA